MDRCTRCTPSIRPFGSVSTCSRNSSRHPSSPNLHIHWIVPRKREERERDSGYRFKPGFPRTRHPIPAPVIAPGPELPTSGPTPFSVRARLFIGSTRPLLSVIRRDLSVRMLVVWSSSDRVHASSLVLYVPSRESTHSSPTLALVFFFCRSRSPAATVLS